MSTHETNQNIPTLFQYANDLLKGFYEENKNDLFDNKFGENLYFSFCFIICCEIDKHYKKLKIDLYNSYKKVLIKNKCWDLAMEAVTAGSDTIHKAYLDFLINQ